MPQVLIRMDAAGEWPVLVDDGEELPTGDGVGRQWPYVCDVGTIAEANAVRTVRLRARLSPSVAHDLEQERVAAVASLKAPAPRSRSRSRPAQTWRS